jgi:uncharacterized protein (TIGR03437 family)
VTVGVYKTAAAVNAADFDPQKPLAPGEVITIFGDALSGETASSTTEVPVLGGTSVDVIDEDGNETPLGETFVSPNQINGRLSPGVKPGRVRLIVRPRGRAPSKAEAQVSSFSPVFFTEGATGQGAAQGYIVRVLPDNTQVTETLPSIDLAPPDDRVFVVLYGTGFRGVRDPAAVRCALTVRREGFIGGQEVTPSFIGAADHVGPGVDQINIEVPRLLAQRAGNPGIGDVECQGEGRTTNRPGLTYR